MKSIRSINIKNLGPHRTKKYLKISHRTAPDQKYSKISHQLGPSGARTKRCVDPWLKVYDHGLKVYDLD